MNRQLKQNKKAQYEVFEFGPDQTVRVGIAYNDSFSNARDALSIAHWHNELEVVYVLGGQDKYIIDGEAVCSQKGQLIVVNPGEVHYVEVETAEPKVVQSEDKVAYIILFLAEEFLKRHLPLYQNIKFLRNIILKEDVTGIIGRIIDYMDDQAIIPKEKGVFDNMLINGLTQQLLYCMCQSGLDEAVDLTNCKNSNNEKTKEIMQYIKVHFHEQITQMDIAEHFFFSQQSFSRFFKHNVGMNFTEYLTRLRLKQARKELLETDHCIIEIALNNGFSSEKSCILFFKKYYGETPAKYRKGILNIK